MLKSSFSATLSLQESSSLQHCKLLCGKWYNFFNAPHFSAEKGKVSPIFHFSAILSLAISIVLCVFISILSLWLSHRQVPISRTSYAYNFWSSCQIFIFCILMESSFQVKTCRAQEHPNRSWINGDMGTLKNALLSEDTFISPKAGFGRKPLGKGVFSSLVSRGMLLAIGKYGNVSHRRWMRYVSSHSASEGCLITRFHQLNFKCLYLLTRSSNSDVLHIIGSYFQLDIYSLKFLRFKLYWKKIWVLKFDIDILGKVKWVFGQLSGEGMLPTLPSWCLGCEEALHLPGLPLFFLFVLL